MEKYYIKGNGSFGILNLPVAHKQHQNQQKGLDLYIKVVNFDTGEVCFKKIYRNTKGYYFKHTGYPPQYYDDYVDWYTYIPFQIIKGTTSI